MADPNLIIANRYILHERLGKGGMGAVYRAYDRLTGNEVALKRVQTIGHTRHQESHARLALTNEFQTLASLRHPNIVSVMDYGFDEDRQPFFTMTMLKDVKTITEAARLLSNEQKAELLIQMLQALAYLHRRGVLHCDLKPDNALVVDGVVKVLDFGLAAHENRIRKDDNVSGTLAYIAPEVLRGDSPTVSADLYAVGLIAYEMFVGGYPFDMNDVNHLVYQIISDAPDLSPLKKTEPLVSGVMGSTTQIDLDGLSSMHTGEIHIVSSELLNARLAALLETLLAKDPALRMDSALDTIVALCEAVNLPVPAENAAIRESFLQAAQFVGRDAELAQLNQALDTAVRGSGDLWWVSGESGVGKSRLLDELRIRALVDGVTVLRGGAVSESGKPYHVWREPLRRLALMTPLDDADAAILKAIVPDIETLLGRSVPELPETDPTSKRQQVIATVTSMFNRNKQPTLLLVEDLHWAGDESLALLRHLAQVLPDLPLLVVGSFRDDEEGSLPTSGFQQPNLLQLARLSKEEVSQLSAAMLGKAGRNREMVTLLHRETEGNIFFLVEVVRALVEDAGDLHRVGQITLPSTIFAGGVQRIVQRRLQRVGDQALPLLRIAAVAGRALDLALLEHMARALPEPVNMDTWVTDCANAHVLVVQDERWQFAHDKLREALLSGLSDGQRARMHRQVAEALESVYPNDPLHVVALARHWQDAGEAFAHKERHYTALAGEQMLQISAYHDCIAYCAHALTLTEQLGGDVQPERPARLRRLIGTAHARLDNFEEAQTHLEASIALAGSHLPERIAAVVELAELVRLRGEFAVAAEKLGEALSLARTLDDPRLLGNVLVALGAVAFSRGDHAAAQGYLGECLMLVERTGDLLTRARSMQVLATIDGAEGRFDEAIPHLEETVTLFMQLGNRDFAARNQINLGEMRRFLGKTDEAYGTLQKAIQMLQDVGSLGLLTVPYSSLGEIAVQQGNLQQARQHLCTALRYSQRIGDAPYTLMMLGSIAKYLASQGDYGQAVLVLGYVTHHPKAFHHVVEMAQTDSETFRKHLSHGQGNQLLEQGKASSLEALLERVRSALVCEG